MDLDMEQLVTLIALLLEPQNTQSLLQLVEIVPLDVLDAQTLIIAQDVMLVTDMKLILLIPQICFVMKIVLLINMLLQQQCFVKIVQQLILTPNVMLVQKQLVLDVTIVSSLMEEIIVFVQPLIMSDLMEFVQLNLTVVMELLRLDCAQVAFLDTH
jgi:hypothetical protein